jgi:hypothetical protein
MDAREVGFGYALPMPRFTWNPIGHVVFIDKDGVATTSGALADDEHFQALMKKAEHSVDFSSTTEKLPYRPVAFTTGCVDVRPLTESELSGQETPLVT